MQGNIKIYNNTYDTLLKQKQNVLFRLETMQTFSKVMNIKFILGLLNS